MQYNLSNLLSADRSYTREDFVFFWGHTGKATAMGKFCLSQWYGCSFTVDGTDYNCAEQYMMAEKARLFEDEVTRLQILESHEPMTIKGLGREVKNFDDKVWREHCCEIVKRGNFAKFSQNQALSEYLLGTCDRILVEASPKDTIWGIGLAENAPEVCNPYLWKGKNLLGFTLMEVRDMLRAQDARIRR